MLDNGWENYIAAPIETYHGEAMREFHKGAEFTVNEVVVEGVRYINGIEFNRLLAKFKTKIMKTYRISPDAIPCSSKITSDKDRKIIQDVFYDLMSKEPNRLKESSPEAYKKLKSEIKNLEAKLAKAVEAFDKLQELAPSIASLEYRICAETLAQIGEKGE